MADAYVNCCRVLFEHYKDAVKYWLTYNGQNMPVCFGAADNDDLRNSFYLDPLVFGTYPKSLDKYFALNGTVARRDFEKRGQGCNLWRFEV